MKTLLASLSLLATLTFVIPFLRVEHASGKQSVMPQVNAEGTKLLARQPVAFVPNLGQWDHSANYVARFGPMAVFLQDKGWTFTLAERRHGETAGVPPIGARARARHHRKPAQGRGVAVRMSFVGANAPKVVAEHPLPGRHNYFL